MKKISLIFAVFLAFALFLGVGIRGAQADSILFPYVAVQPGVYSFISIANEGLNEFATLTGYHLSYGYKAVPVVNKRGCNHYDVNITSTPQDLLTFEVGGKVTDAGSYILFEGNPPATSTGDPRMLGATNHVGFLIVEPIGNSLAAEITDRIEVWGWADIVDTAANMNLSYSTHNFGVNDSTNPDFTVSNVGNTWHRISWMPTAYVTTSWHVLPLGLRSDMTPAAGGGIRAVIRPNNGLFPGAFDRDEAFFSGEKIATVRCLGIITTADLLQPGPIAATLNGGFAYAESWGGVVLPVTDPDDPGGIYSARQMLLHRIQAATAAAGLGTRQAINREPALDPAYNITLDVGP